MSINGMSTNGMAIMGRAPAVAVALLLFGGVASAQNEMPSLLDAEPPKANTDDIERFCSNIADAARERRYAMQKAELEALKAQLDERIAQIEQKKTELQVWVERRQQFAEAANKTLVDVFAQMRPDAAAQRLEKMPGELSAALLSQLSARQAGTILNEMSADKAAVVSMIMAAVGDMGERVQ